MNKNNELTSHNINPTNSVNYSEQTIPSNMKSYESFRKIKTSNLKIKEKATEEEDEYLKYKYSELNLFLKGR